MSNPEIIAVAALGRKTRFICAEDKLIWNNPTDLKRVKNLTVGFPLIMGRKTHESIGKALPGRTNIVMTTNKGYSAEGCKIAHSREEALEIAKNSPGGDKQIIIFGGSEIYKEFLDITDKLVLTLVDSDSEGTHQFPPYEDRFEFLESHGSHEFNGDTFEWVDYTRKK